MRLAVVAGVGQLLYGLFLVTALRSECPTLALTQDADPTGRIIRILPEPVFENLQRDKWKGEPSGPALSLRVLDDGVLELTTDKGWLYTRRNYYDFRLEYEARVAEGGRHRVFFRSLEWPRQAYEFRVEQKDGLLAAQIIAARWNMREEKIRIPDQELRAATDGKDWHRIGIYCEGTRALILVNGRRVLAIGALDALGGRIGFAGERVAYRSARLTPAPGGPAIFNNAYVPGVEESLEMPTVVREVRPRMPPGATKNRGDYVVVVEVVIDEDGNVAGTRFLRRLNENLGYNDEAMRVVREWKFTPARLHGKAVPVLVTIELKFTWE